MQPITVLLAEDYPAVRIGIHDILTRAEGIQVVAEASDGEQALELAQALNPDVVILDLGLPRVDGVGVARQIRSADLPIRILALSIYADPSLVRSLVEIGIDGYLMKEEAPELIVEAVRGVVNGEQGWYSHKVISTLADTLRGKDGPPRTLSEREQEVIRLVSQGKTNQEIAYILGVSESTIEKNMRNVCKKLEADSRTEAAVRAVREHLI
jgi:DNA-binding NarL/FixJ family response regulator